MFGRYLLAIASLLALPATAAAQIVTDGESLRQRCASVQLLSPSAGLGCRGYVGAVVDILADGNSIYEFTACPPPGAQREMVIKAVRAWLDGHPQFLKTSASAVTAQALSEIFPCKSP